jgi:hypothetical protein
LGKHCSTKCCKSLLYDQLMGQEIVELTKALE